MCPATSCCARSAPRPPRTPRMTDLHTFLGRAFVAAAIAAAALPVTASEVQQRLARIREEAARNRTPLPPAPALRKQVLDALVDERVLVTNARESGARVDEPELDRAVANVAQQNQMTMAQ